MSTGSLNIRGDLGKWSAATGLNNLAVNQTALTVAGFMRVVSFSTSAPGSTVFGQVLAPLQAAFGVQVGGGNNAVIFIKGVTGTCQYSSPIVAGQTIHFA